MPRFAATLLLTVGLLLVSVGCDNDLADTESVPDALATPPGWSLVWSDEFNDTSLDTTKWSYQLGDGCPDLCGWGNNELQFYDEESVSFKQSEQVDSGVLVITADREIADGDTSYSAARLRTFGKGDWTYGRFEVRAKLPEGQGMWPAIWLLFSEPTYGIWAASGEIDIMEAVGNKPGEIFGTIHYGDEFPGNVFTGKERALFSGDFSDEFYVFTTEWERVERGRDEDGNVIEGVDIRWFVNNVPYFTLTEEDWFSTGSEDPTAPFNHDFYMILNVAVGGNLPGPPDETTVFPQTMEVDYVRVYQRDA
ncbi:MAG: glycoside hydrolase family 16 protein [Bacteroidota bacterium]